MAIRDDERPVGRTRMDRARDSSSMLPLILGAIVAGLLAWWLFSNYSTGDVGPARTSPPVTNSAPNTTTPTTTPKQP